MILKQLFIAALLLFVPMVSAAQLDVTSYIEPSIRDFVEINPSVKLHYANTGFDIKAFAIIKGYTVIYSQSTGKMFLVDNQKHFVVDEWDFKQDGKYRFISMGYVVRGKDGSENRVWKQKMPISHNISITSNSDTFFVGEVNRHAKTYALGFTESGDKIHPIEILLKRNDVFTDIPKKVKKSCRQGSFYSCLTYNGKAILSYSNLPTSVSSASTDRSNYPAAITDYVVAIKEGEPSKVIHETPLSDSVLFWKRSKVFIYQGKPAYFSERKMSITLFSKELSQTKELLLDSATLSLYRIPTNKFYSYDILRDDATDRIFLMVSYFDTVIKKSMQRLFYIDIEKEGKLVLVKTISRGLSSPFLYNNRLFFTYKPTDTDKEAIFSVAIDGSSNDTLNFQSPNSINIKLYKSEDRFIDYFKNDVSGKSFEPLNVDGVKVYLHKKIIIPSCSTVQELCSAALPLLKEKRYGEFAITFCRYNYYDRERIRYLLGEGHVTLDNPFQNEESAQLLSTLISGIASGAVAPELEHKTGFIEATTPNGWKFILIKGIEGYRFGSWFYKKI